MGMVRIVMIKMVRIDRGWWYRMVEKVRWRKSDGARVTNKE